MSSTGRCCRSPSRPAYASLMARLDRLASVREVAQMGAAIGREFSYELLALLTPLPDEQLRQALQQLASTEFVFSRGAHPAQRTPSSMPWCRMPPIRRCFGARASSFTLALLTFSRHSSRTRRRRSPNS